MLHYVFCYSFSAYSNDELDQLEKEFVREINQSDAILRNPLAVEYINHLAIRLGQHGELEKQPDFSIVKSNEINAFAGPGGHIGVNTQLILASENESELAAVMAHEMSHVRQHHLYRMMEHQKRMRIPMIASILASMALGIINPTLASGAMMGSLTGIAQDNISFVRSNEKEADSIGIDMLIKSGLDPRGMAGFFKKMQEATRYYYTDNIPSILRTHPLDEDRIAEAENRSLHIAKKYYPDNLNYRLFKELVRLQITKDPKNLIEFYKKECMKSTTKNVCQYGYALTKSKMGENKAAILILEKLIAEDPSNLFYLIALIRAEEGDSQIKNAVAKLAEMHNNHPDNYTIYLEYGNALMLDNQYTKAVSILLKAHWEYRGDLAICNKLARAQAMNNKKAYAYFTLAECHLIQGEKHDAVNKLKTAKSMNKNDEYLAARIDAKIEEIRSEERRVG